ncbi:excinuclease ABC subunit UvrA [Oceanirhabdus sp. W0125-5]|uniref:excinuclease ABC subunit UvrA n=1 Tax=Oceanirhabdus sp. W0125-5 TaxID=2999116 RepID=UPI0022F32E3E|nr:excinuclease ABC subunit UvrA [Oceanirhabdus sp. W0125-5]WBW95000.1 excinuclease ABC subunit UvrA [Oceanirhabdus sp. W0125-5]
MIKNLEIKGARVNNLKDISVNIPKNALTVVTGVSGSGKSSLVFDVIFSEGQRRFLSSLNTYARRFAPLLKKPDVDFVFGLSPVLAISQKKGINNPRSTVGTMTDISDYLRVLFSSLGTINCPYCSHEFESKTTNQIVEHILTLPEGTTVEIYAPVNKVYGEDYDYLFDEIRSKGYRKFRVDGVLLDSGKKHGLDDNKEYRIEVLIDKFVIKDSIHKQLTETINNGLFIGECFLCIDIYGEKIDENALTEFYNRFGCKDHHIVVGELLPYYFTPNESDSACSTCRGTGIYRKAEPRLVVDKWNKTIRQGALTNTFLSIKHPGKYMMLYSLAQHYNFSLDIPFKELPLEAQNVLFYGTNGEKIKQIRPDDVSKKHPDEGKFLRYSGIINQLDKAYRISSRKGDAEYNYDFIYKKHMSEQVCPECNGTKLKRQRMLVNINGKNIYELGEMPIDELVDFLESTSIPLNKKQIGDQILKEITSRLKLLLDVGLNYINLNRRGDSVSGGELQRIRLSTQLSSGLSGMLYVLDEPSIGLHSRDSNKIIKTLKQLVDAGNTVLVVEHDMDTIAAADHIIEVGPGPGNYGGQIMAEGNINEISKDKKSLTGQYLSGSKNIPLPQTRRESNGNYISIRGARENNLKNVNVDIPLGVFICVTGVSGSGKSSLINSVLHKGLHSKLYDIRTTPGKHDSIEGYECINNVINIDQSPIGRNSRSNPATYIGFFNKIRDLFADTDDAKKWGYEKSHFSSNNKDGRCDECAGNGLLITELQFMPDVETVCPACKGTGFSKDILKVKYRGKNISEVLNMSVEEALQFFSDHKYIEHKLKVMAELGLGYIKLGQSSSTLSGGEAQRIKLASELGKIKRGAHNLYILDEPTTGLHLSDIKYLLNSLSKLVNAGHTVLVIEHHMDVIKSSDHIIDIGPEAGKLGGYVVAEGTPEEIMNVSESYTAQFLRKVL